MNALSIALRPTCANDEPFLFNVYASTRLEELAPLGWSVEQQTAFLTLQFNAQRQHYRTYHASADFQLILLDGRAVGRVYVERGQDAISIIDIAILPAYRNAGIGSHLLSALLDEAAQTSKYVQIHVEKRNPALRLYKRLGFSIIDDRGVYWFMQWTPAGVTAAKP